MAPVDEGAVTGVRFAVCGVVSQKNKEEQMLIVHFLIAPMWKNLESEWGLQACRESYRGQIH